MAPPALSPGLLLAPLWGLAAARLGLLQLARPVIEAQVDTRHPLPPVEALRALADAPVAGLHLHLSGVQAGWATLQATHTALLAVRESGRPVVVELETTGNAELLLASAASHVVIRPASHVQLIGVGAALRFSGEALERLGVRVDVEAAGAYKSLGEAFTRRWASPENREAMAAIVEDLQGQLEEAIARGRGKSVEQVRAWLAAAPLSAEQARETGLVDGVAYPDEVRDWWKERLGKKPRRLQMARWWKRRSARDRVAARVRGGERVAVLHLSGNVVDGHGSGNAPVIAAVPAVEAIDAVREDEGVRAVVLHVRSPGGSAAASDLIWRAVQRLAETRPVVAVFGDVAASGGYYLAAPAREILVQPGTLTGSIGVVGGKLVLAGVGQKLGVHTELLLGAPMAAIWSPNRPFEAEERARFRVTLQDTYAAFLDRVGRGRRRPVEAIEPLARGRVWSGARAMQVGLVDGFGGVEEGVARAAALAGLPRWRRQDVPVGPKPGLVQRLLRRAMEGDSRVAGALAWAERLALPASVRVLSETPGQPLAWAWGVDSLWEEPGPG